MNALPGLDSGRLRTAAGVLLLVLVAKVGVLCLFYNEGEGAEAVQQRLLADTEPSTRVAVPPPSNPIFRPDAFFFWFNSEYFATAYLDWCQLNGAPPTRVEGDRRVWREHPPRFVYVPKGEPSWAPFEFAQHRRDYVETDVPGLWELSSHASR